MSFLKWFALFVAVFFASMWVARQTGHSLDNPWTLVVAAVISAAIVVGFWYRYMVDLMSTIVKTPEIGLGANRTEAGERITHLNEDKEI